MPGTDSQRHGPEVGLWEVEPQRPRKHEHKSRELSELRESCNPFPRGENGVTAPAFLWRGHVHSGFEEGIRRTQCDQKLGIRS